MAWGRQRLTGFSTTLGTGSLASSQTKSIKASVISKFNPSNQGSDESGCLMVLHLKSVSVWRKAIRLKVLEVKMSACYFVGLATSSDVGLDLIHGG
ncbi:MAG: hypothetical protein ACLVEJ_14640 [Parabacteroides sp.]